MTSLPTHNITPPVSTHCCLKCWEVGFNHFYPLTPASLHAVALVALLLGVDEASAPTRNVEPRMPCPGLCTKRAMTQPDVWNCLWCGASFTANLSRQI